MNTYVASLLAEAGIAISIKLMAASLEEAREQARQHGLCMFQKGFTYFVRQAA